jgi:hypothetical protein
MMQKMLARCMCPETAGNNSERTSRAPRFAIQMPLRFRASGATEWHEGKSINVSRTGILFQSDIDLLPNTLLEMQLILPPEIVGKANVNVLCWGPVVRMVVPISAKEQTTSAAVILRYRFASD